MELKERRDQGGQGAARGDRGEASPNGSTALLLLEGDDRDPQSETPGKAPSLSDTYIGEDEEDTSAQGVFIKTKTTSPPNPGTGTSGPPADLSNGFSPQHLQSADPSNTSSQEGDSRAEQSQ